MSGQGRVYLVGAGPWDPGLLTVRGAELLPLADVILYDYLVNPAIVSQARPDAIRSCVGHPPNRMSQDEIHENLIRHAKAGRTVVRLKGGDPFVFGRGGEEADALAEHGIEFEIVPGITAAVASAAYAGIPVTHRDFGSTLALCTGHTQADASDELDWAGLARLTTLVLYMAARRLPEIAQKLMDAGRAIDTPVALVRWATRPDQETVVTTLSNLVKESTAAQLQPPVLVIVGGVVSLRKRIAWRESRPLHGETILITRDAEGIEALAKPLRDAGANPIPFPVIEFEPRWGSDVKSAVNSLASYDWLLFTSGNGVDFFCKGLWDAGFDARALHGLRIGCIGPSTAARLERWGLRADLVPPSFVAESLLEVLKEAGVNHKRILIPRAAKARELLPQGLRESGACVDVVTVYETLKPELDELVISEVSNGDHPWLTFTASSTVEHFCAAFSHEELQVLQSRCRAACIGPITAKTATKHGFRVDVVAEEFTLPGLVDAMVQWGRAQILT